MDSNFVLPGYRGKSSSQFLSIRPLLMAMAIAAVAGVVFVPVIFNGWVER